MSLLSDLQAQIASLQAKVAILNRVPSDTYNFGTIALFAANGNNTKWYFVKVGEELWRQVGTTEQNSLAYWVLKAFDDNVGYFEVYIMTPGVAPIFTSS